MKLNTSLVFNSILVFHILITIYSFYIMDYDGWTLHHWKPFCYVLFTLTWLGVCSKNYVWGFAYIGLVIAEFLFFAVFRSASWATIFGNVLFPIDLIFVAVLLILFKTHFGILQGSDGIQDSTRDKA